jgi:hypothetical protein
MKDRMIIIREGVMFIITITHGSTQKPEQEEADNKDTDQKDQKDIQLPFPISAN